MATTIITKNGSGAPTADDLSVGELAVDLTNKRLYSKNSSSEVIELGVNAAADTTFGDNVKAIFGAGSDLQIYHDATDSIINDNGTGSLKLQQGGSTKLEVTTTGIDVTGTVTADGLTVDGSGSFVASANDSFLSIAHTGTEARLSATYTSTGSWTPIVLRTQNESRLNIATNGDISFYEDTGTTPKLVWKAADERLGIGTSSPSEALDVSNSIAVGLNIKGTGANTTLYNPSADMYVRGGTGSKLSLGANNTNDLMVLDASGNVGIGVDTSLSNKLTIEAASQHLRLQGTSNNNKNVSIQYNESGDYGQINCDESGVNQQDLWITGLNLKFGRNTSTATMTLDSSGNLLVGTTDINPSQNAVEGIALSAGSYGGYFSAARSGGVVAQLARLTNDGDILNFRNSTDSVGSIVTSGGDLAIGTGNTKLRFNDASDAIYSGGGDGSGTNAGTDLGTSDYKFGDLYLSGGVYVGGTGSANYLDDYEEGTWTPTLAVNGFSASATLSSATGVYTKIGNLVYINAEIVMSGQTYPSSYCQITGIPFTGSYSMSSAGVYDGVNPSSGTQGGSASGGATGLFLTPMGTTTTSTTWRISIVLTTA